MESKSHVKPMGAAMEGDGFYNRNSAMQAAGIARLLPYWEAAVSSVPLDGSPITIADYASSQGRNSMAPMRVAIDELRSRGSGSTPITVVHTDLPTNDFVALFTALNDEPHSYLNGTANVYASAIGRSYFHPLFPAGTVLLGWNAWSVHWMSGEPINAPDQVLPLLSQSTAVH